MKFITRFAAPAITLLALAAYPAFAQNTVLNTNFRSLPGVGTGGGNVVMGPGNSYPAASYASSNVFVGEDAGRAATTGDNNAFVGYWAGRSTTEGEENVFLGSYTGYSNTTGSLNIFIGTSAGYSNTDGYYNVFTGYEAGYRNTTGESNVFTGFQAGFLNDTGANNVFTGPWAGYSNATGASNAFTDYQAGYSNRTGASNIFTGYQAGYKNTAGNGNAFTGHQAGYDNTTGYQNVFTGSHAGFSNKSGRYNAFTGNLAGYSNTTGEGNVFTGYLAGYSNTTGDNNTLLGTFSDATGSDKANLNRATAIGYKARVGLSDGLVLGDPENDNVKVGIGTAYPNQRLTIRGNMNFVAYDNSLRLKNQPFLHFNEHESLALGLGAEIPAGAEKTLVLGSNETTVQIPGLLNARQPNASQFLTIDARGKVILAQPRVQVASVSDWSDKVFEPVYALRPLSEVAEFIKKNKHLPGVPSAEIMVAEGMESNGFFCIFRTQILKTQFAKP